ncbi:putative receptor-like protein kinase At5g39000 [Euphorbia lathyris]|uniref:putative receptor-like protein kinase At5g39000 n=1 Tax=Euphorbia lathyris TaxID=212925 RepID=UPI0033141E5F
MLISCKLCFIFLKFLIITVHGDFSEIFHPTHNILVNCGDSGNSTGADGREWIGDIDIHSKFVSLTESNSTIDSISDHHLIPYNSVRIFHSQLTYTFHVTSGQKIIRFYFRETPAMDHFNSSKILFSVKISSLVLLSSFTPADSFAKEFFLNVQENQLLNITFTPSDDSYGFINGIEMVSIDNSEARTKRKLTVNQANKSKISITKIAAISVATVLGVMILILAGLLIFCYCKRPRLFTDDSTKSLQKGVCRRFTAEEIRNATNDFDRALVIGNGGFGRVFKGHIDNENKPVAIKALKPTSTQGSQEFWAEIEMLSKLRHRHLVSLVGYCNEEHMMILVYDYMAHGTLLDHLYQTQNPPLSWKQRLQICIGAACGVKFLHTGAEHCIIHRDIKSSNILLDENWVPKVSDFGLSRLGPASISRSHVTTEVKGTFGYLDPEYYFTNHLTVKSDVFSFGVLLFEVLCARPAVDMKLDEEQHSLALWAKQHFREGTLDQIIDPNLTGEIAPESLKIYAKIAVKCLRNNRNDRPTMSNVLTKLEAALKLQEGADAAAEEGIMLGSGSGKEVISYNGNKSGCFAHSCPTFWHKSSNNCQFLSEGGRVNNGNKMGRKRQSLRGLRGVFYAVFGYKSLARDTGESSNSSEVDYASDEMMMEIMTHH